jgi:hypothetical protein
MESLDFGARAIVGAGGLVFRLAGGFDGRDRAAVQTPEIGLAHELI